MPDRTPGATPNVFPFLSYHDARAAIRWLGDAFGFEEKSVHAGPDGSVGHAELRLGPGVVMLGSRKDGPLGLKTPAELGAVTGGIYVFVEDADTHFARAVDAGAEVVIELRDTDYGTREYAARDPEGNLWSFGTYLP